MIKPVLMIRPLCPTHFTVRGSSVQSLVNQYGWVHKTLQEVTLNYSPAMRSKACGLHDNLHNVNYSILPFSCLRYNCTTGKA